MGTDGVTSSEFSTHLRVVRSMFHECTSTILHTCDVIFHPSSPEDQTMYVAPVQGIPAVGASSGPGTN